MILNYRDRQTEKFSQGDFIKAFQGFEQQAARRLAILNAAPSLGTPRILPSNRLEGLKGDRAGQFPSGSTSNGASAVVTAQAGAVNQACGRAGPHLAPFFLVQA